MCGIVGYVGPDEALPVVIEGLRRLEYRGLRLGRGRRRERRPRRREAGRQARRAREGARRRARRAGSVGMGHTRWATHGAPTDRNAHPHVDCAGRIAVIHNGIVENFQSLRGRLEKDGHGLASETDTEVVAHLVENHLKASEGGGRLSLAEAVRRTVLELEGAFSLVVCSADEPDSLIGVKVSSPLVVGLGEHETILASDIPAVLGRTDTVVPMDEGWLVAITRGGVAFCDLEGTPIFPEPIEVSWDVGQAQKGGYDSFMRKEIDEQPAAIRDTLVGRTVNGRLVLDELRVSDDVLREVSKVFVVACGTAFHSGLVAKYAIEHWTRLPVEVEIASEFRYRDPVLGPDTLTLAVSQSGETIDTLEAARHARRQGSQVIAVTNTVGLVVVSGGRRGLLHARGSRDRRRRDEDVRDADGVAAPRRAVPRAGARDDVPRRDRRRPRRAGHPAAQGRDRDRARGPGRARSRSGTATRGHVVPRPPHGVPGGARRGAEAEGAQLPARRGISGGRAEARADRARRGGGADRRRRDAVPRLPEDAVEHPGGQGPRRHGDRGRHGRRHRGREARRSRPRGAGDARAALAGRRDGADAAARVPHRPDPRVSTSISPGTSRRA